MDEAEVGMEVTLKSGGPVMTVLRVIGASERHAKMDELLKMKGYDDDDVYCQWVMDSRSNKMKKHAFKLSMLKPANATQKEDVGEELDDEEEDFDF